MEAHLTRTSRRHREAAKKIAEQGQRRRLKWGLVLLLLWTIVSIIATEECLSREMRHARRQRSQIQRSRSELPPIATGQLHRKANR